MMPCPGKRPASTARMACSAVRSATVTGLRSSLRSAASGLSPPERKNGPMTGPAPSAAASAAAIQPSIAAPFPCPPLTVPILPTRWSDPLEVAGHFPFGDAPVGPLLLPPRGAHVVVDHVVAEGFAEHRRAIQGGGGVPQRGRDLGL